MSEEKYIQFPLCALAFGEDEKDRLHHIISYGFVEVGNAMLAKLDSSQRREKASEFKQSGVDDYRHTDGDHIAAMLGAGATGIEPGHLGSSISRHRALSGFLAKFMVTYGADAETRIRKSLCFEVRDGKGMSYREFSILCAIYSLIGAKKYPVRITRKSIQHRALGYKSDAMFRAEYENRTDGALPLTFRQINYTLDKLDELKWFARARANERQTFYSHRLELDQLENRIVEGKSYAKGFHERRRKRNAELMAKVKAIKADAPIIVNNSGDSFEITPENCSSDVRSPSATVSTALSTGVSTLIKTPLIETPLIETHSIQTHINEGACVLSSEVKEQWEEMNRQLGRKSKLK